MTVIVIYQGLTDRGTLKYITESYQYPIKDIDRFNTWIKNSEKNNVLSENNLEDIIDWIIK